MCGGGGVFMYMCIIYVLYVVFVLLSSDLWVPRRVCGVGGQPSGVGFLLLQWVPGIELRSSGLRIEHFQHKGQSWARKHLLYVRTFEIEKKIESLKRHRGQ